MSKWRKWFWTVLALAIIFAVHYAKCTIYSAVWRAVHGTSIQCGKYRIQVPRAWWARGESNGICHLITWSPTYAIGEQDVILASFHLIPDSPSPNDKQWRQDALSRLQRAGYSVTRELELQVAGRVAFCFEYNIPSKIPEQYVICNIEKGMVVEFSYEGKEWKARFYEILRDVS
jgi:hypothetical protein